MPSMLYRLLFATVTEKEVENAIMPAWKALKNKIHLPSVGAPNQLLKAVGIGDLWNSLKVDRLMLLLNCLESGRDTLRHAAEAMVFLEQRMECNEDFVLSHNHCKERGWTAPPTH